MTPILTFTGLMLSTVAACVSVTLVALGLALRLLDEHQPVTAWAAAVAILAAGCALTAAALVTLSEPLADLAGI